MRTHGRSAPSDADLRDSIVQRAPELGQRMQNLVWALAGLPEGPSVRPPCGGPGDGVVGIERKGRQRELDVTPHEEPFRSSGQRTGDLCAGVDDVERGFERDDPSELTLGARAANRPFRGGHEFALDREIVDAGVGLERVRVHRHQVSVPDEIVRVTELLECRDQLLRCRPEHPQGVCVALVDDRGRIGSAQEVVHAPDCRDLRSLDVQLHEIDALDVVLREDLRHRPRLDLHDAR